MAMKDISWGSVILGAAAVTAVAAVGMASGGFLAPLLASLTTTMGATAANATILGGAAVTGGIAGEFVSDLLRRGRDACSTLLEPRR